MTRRTLAWPMAAIFLCVGCSQEISAINVLGLVEHCDYAFRGRIVELEEAPGTWSGTFLFHQDVTYEVISAYKGQLPPPGEKIVAHHMLWGSDQSTADIVPRLDPAVMVLGREVVVFGGPPWTTGLPEGIHVSNVLFVDQDRLTVDPPPYPRPPHRLIHARVECPGLTARDAEFALAEGLRRSLAEVLPSSERITTITADGQVNVYLSHPCDDEGVAALLDRTREAVAWEPEDDDIAEYYSIAPPTVTVTALKPGATVPRPGIRQIKTIHVDLDKFDREDSWQYEDDILTELRLPEGDVDEQDLDAIRAQVVQFPGGEAILGEIATLRIVHRPRPIIRICPDPNKDPLELDELFP